MRTKQYAQEMKPWMMVKILTMYYIIYYNSITIIIIKNLTFNKILQW